MMQRLYITRDGVLELKRDFEDAATARQFARDYIAQRRKSSFEVWDFWLVSGMA